MSTPNFFGVGDILIFILSLKSEVENKIEDIFKPGNETQAITMIIFQVHDKGENNIFGVEDEA